MKLRDVAYSNSIESRLGNRGMLLTSLAEARHARFGWWLERTSDVVTEFDMIFVGRDRTQTAYDAGVSPVLTIASGSTIEFRTHDARAGALLDKPLAVSYDLPKPDRSRGNPVSGPVFVEGARPGDALLVEILAIDCEPLGWCGAHAHVAPVPAGRVPRALGRTCRVTTNGVEFAPNLTLPLRPMIGCIGTAPLKSVSTQLAGPHGGNMDQPVVGVGSTVLLPIRVDGALLSLGDVHATQGDGELSGLALEIPSSVRVRIRVLPCAAPAWPWVRTEDVVAVMTASETFESAASSAVGEGMDLLENVLSLAPAEALALLSLSSDIRVGAAWGGPQVTVRLEIPATLGVAPTGLDS